MPHACPLHGSETRPWAPSPWVRTLWQIWGLRGDVLLKAGRNSEAGKSYRRAADLAEDVQAKMHWRQQESRCADTSTANLENIGEQLSGGNVSQVKAEPPYPRYFGRTLHKYDKSTQGSAATSLCRHH